MISLRSLVAASSLFLIVGCGTAPSIDEQGRASQAFITYHHSMAVAHAEAGRLYDARIHWQILSTVHFREGMVSKEIAQLTRIIDKKTKPLLKKAKLAFKANQFKNAQKDSLLVLKIDPQNTQAIEMLRELSGIQVNNEQLSKNRRSLDNATRAALPAPSSKKLVSLKKKQSSKLRATDSDHKSVYLSRAEQTSSVEANSAPKNVRTSSQPISGNNAQGELLEGYHALYRQKDYQQLIEQVEAVSWSGAIPAKLQSWLLNAFAYLSQDLNAAGQYRDALNLLDRANGYPDPLGRLKRIGLQSRKKLAQKLYAEGKALLHRDLDQAIELWEQGLSYDEGYSELRFELEKAYRIRTNLKRISKGGG